MTLRFENRHLLTETLKRSKIQEPNSKTYKNLEGHHYMGLQTPAIDRWETL